MNLILFFHFSLRTEVLLLFCVRRERWPASLFCDPSYLFCVSTPAIQDNSKSVNNSSVYCYSWAFSICSPRPVHSSSFLPFANLTNSSMLSRRRLISRSALFFTSQGLLLMHVVVHLLSPDRAICPVHFISLIQCD